MRIIYIATALAFVICVALLIGAFFYLDKENRATYLYAVNLDGHDIGSIRIDKYVTENKRVYKSVSTMPFADILTESRSRLAYDRKYDLESYEKESSGNGASEAYTLVQKNNLLSFASVFDAEFITLSAIPVRKGRFLLEQANLATYLPFVENYDFRKGRAQSFFALSHFSKYLPPMKVNVTLTSIRDEYLKIEGHNVKTECLLVKIRNHPTSILWVSKADKSIIRFETPSKHLRITRRFAPKAMTFAAEDAAFRNEAYTESEVTFKSGPVILAGTLTVPAKEGRHPAILLIGGYGPCDRSYHGLFSSLADNFGREGYVVLRYDGRGIGSSKGDPKATTDGEATEDAIAALEFLAAQEKADPARIVVVGHSKGAFYAAKAVSRKKGVSGVALLTPLMAASEDESLKNIDRIARRQGWNEEYAKLAKAAETETLNRARFSGNDWTSILGTRCFLKKTRERLAGQEKAAIKIPDVPVLLIQGREDEPLPVHAVSVVDMQTAAETGMKHAVMYAGEMGYFFGTRVNDGLHKFYYQVDPGLAGMIKKWIDWTFAEAAAAKAAAEAAAAKAAAEAAAEKAMRNALAEAPPTQEAPK
ncbi:MAG: alpha/beta hydrolase [Candidatus Omnitrophica bacterium]|nr:alpha/beta hydrolase [Candidatus Omnitrophota bacterium]